jgi:hypothetical protein
MGAAGTCRCDPLSVTADVLNACFGQTVNYAVNARAPCAAGPVALPENLWPEHNYALALVHCAQVKGAWPISPSCHPVACN